MLKYIPRERSVFFLLLVDAYLLLCFYFYCYLCIEKIHFVNLTPPNSVKIVGGFLQINNNVYCV